MEAQRSKSVIRACEGCGRMLDATEDVCPDCHVSRKQSRRFWRKFWLSLIIGSLAMAAAAGGIVLFLQVLGIKN